MPAVRPSRARLAFAIALLCPSLAVAQSPSADDILARFAKAIDPQGKILALPGLRSVGTMEIPAAGMTAQLSMVQGAPDKLLLTMSIPGMGEMKQGFDGTTGWATDPMQGPRLMTDAEKAQVAEESTFLAVVRDKSLRTAAEVVGDADVGGEACTNVKITFRSGRSVTECYSKASGLLLQRVAKQTTPQGEVEGTTVYSDYKDVQGLKIAAKAEVSMMGMKQLLTFTGFEVAAPAAGTFDLPDAIKALKKP